MKRLFSLINNLVDISLNVYNDSARVYKYHTNWQCVNWK